MKKGGMKIVKLLTTVFAAAVMFTCISTTSLAYPETEGKVTVDTAKIRDSADTGSSVKGLIDKGSKVTIIDEVTDGSGTLWYKVKTSDAEGYIRSDLLEKGQPIEQPEQPAENNEAPAEVVTADGVTPMDLQYASINVDAGKMRAGASTSDGIVITLAKGDQVVISGKKTGADGKDWYAVAYTAADGTVSNGFIRNDLIVLGDMVPVEQPEVPEEYIEEEPVDDTSYEEPVVNQDYETVYTDDGTGQNIWYLYDHTTNNRLKLEELLNFVNTEQKRLAGVDELAKKLKLIAIILGVLLSAAIVAIVVLVLKLRDSMYETYDDDEDYEEEDDDEEDDDDEDDDIAPRSRRGGFLAKLRRDEDDDDEDEDEDEDDEEDEDVSPRRPSRQSVKASGKQVATEHGSADEGVRRKPAAKQTQEVTYEEDDTTVEGAKPAKKKKNFVIDDDDFEFEFLNMD